MKGKSGTPEDVRVCFQKHLAALIDMPLESLTGGKDPAETFKKDAEAHRLLAALASPERQRDGKSCRSAGAHDPCTGR